MTNETEQHDEPQDETPETPEVPPPPPEDARATARALAKLEADDKGVLAIIPRDIDEAQRYAKGLIVSGMVPDSYKFSKDEFNDPEDVDKGAPPLKHRKGEVNGPLVLMGLLKSMELGLPPQTGLGTIYPINGKFAVYGDGAIALIQRERIIAKHMDVRIGPAFDPETPLGEWPPEYGWEVRYWRKGQEEPYVGRYTVRDAKRANLWMNSYKKPWIMYPDRMLFNRARAFALRDGFADALMGLGIMEEERDRLPDVDGGELTGPRVDPHNSALDDEPETEEQEGAE